MNKLEQQFFDAWNQHGFKEYPPETQYEIDGKKFDFAWPKERIAIECEGAGWGHSTIKWKHEDAAKKRAAIVLGWTVLSFTTKCLGTAQQREDAIHEVLSCFAIAQQRQKTADKANQADKLAAAIDADMRRRNMIRQNRTTTW